MRHILVEITCRGCAYHTHVKSHTLVKPQLEPILKERILQGTMFTYECPRCHSSVSFIHSFLYHDSERRLLIAMALSDKTINTLREQLPDSQLYTVKNPQQLSEAVKAAEDRLAIESIELLKNQLKKSKKLFIMIMIMKIKCFGLPADIKIMRNIKQCHILRMNKLNRREGIDDE